MPGYFITGIDTGVGKTWATGLLARYLRGRGNAVITQKLVQTGCAGMSEDILAHRRIMETGLFPEDGELTCPYCLPFPGSPHLAARLAGVSLDTGRMRRATEELARRYDCVLVEGSGGLHVPLDEGSTLLEYIGEVCYPVILVTSSRLGSINHTFLTLEALQRRGIPVAGTLYNLYPGADPHIRDDTRDMILRRLERLGYPRRLVDIPLLQGERVTDVDFSPLFP